MFKRVFDGVAYLPGDYLSRVKRPRQGALRSLTIYGLVPWVLVGLSAAPSVYAAVGLVALFLSMWTVYELGYYYNDQCALRYEEDPKLTPEALEFKDRFFEVKGWTTALTLGAIAIWLLHPTAFLIYFGIWLTTLAALISTYWIYNRVDKLTRIWLYPVLQMFRYGSLFAVVIGTPVAFAAVLAQIIQRWIDYVIYRYQRNTGATDWPRTSNQTIKLVLFLLLLVPIMLSGNWSAFFTPASLCAVVFVYGVWKYDWKELRSSFRRLDKNSPSTPAS